jgi:O-antigen ligase
MEALFVDEDAESGQTRLAAWEHNWRVTGQHWLFGTGPAGYAAYYMAYFPDEAMATHSNYIDLIAQTGIFGLGLCMWFFCALVWLGYKLCRRFRGRGDFAEGAANAAFAGTIGVLVAMAIGDWVFPFAYTQTIAGYSYAVYNWLFMGVILVLGRLYPDAKIRD